MKKENRSKKVLPKNIYLIGPMGSGKSSVGRQLERLTGGRFKDVDEEIEERTGVNIPWIFEKEGEEGFRRRESEAIAALTLESNLILATGGGSILREENRERLKSTGKVVYLKVSLDIQFERTNRRQGSRPLLNEPNPKEKLKQINEAREKQYESLADIAINTDKKSALGVAKEILNRVFPRKC